VTADDIDRDEVSPSVHAEVSIEKKIEWLQYAQEHYRGTLSSLIVEAVDKEISDNWVLESEVSNDDVDVDLSAVDELQQMQDQLESISEQIDSVTVDSDSEDGSSGRELERSEMIQLANRIHDTIPLVNGTSELVALKGDTSTLTLQEHAQAEGTVAALAAYLDHPEYEIWQAALFLEQNEDTVHSLIDEGVRSWYELKNRPDARGDR